MVVGAVRLLAAVLVVHGRVGVVHAAVDVGDDDALAAHTDLVPDLRGLDPVDVPLDGVGDGLLPLALGGLGEGDLVVGVDPGDLGPLGEAAGELLAADDAHGVHDPVRGVVGSGVLQGLDDIGLAARGVVLLDPQNRFRLGGAGLLFPRGGEVGGAVEIDPEGGLGGVVELGAELGFYLALGRGQGGGAGVLRGRGDARADRQEQDRGESGERRT